MKDILEKYIGKETDLAESAKYYNRIKEGYIIKKAGIVGAVAGGVIMFFYGALNAEGSGGVTFRDVPGYSGWEIIWLGVKGGMPGAIVSVLGHYIGRLHEKFVRKVYATQIKLAENYHLDCIKLEAELEEKRKELPGNAEMIYFPYKEISEISKKDSQLLVDFSKRWEFPRKTNEEYYKDFRDFINNGVYKIFNAHNENKI